LPNGNQAILSGNQRQEASIRRNAVTLSQQEIAKVRNNAESITLSNEMKSTAVDEKLRTLNAAVKKLLAKKDATVEIFVMKGKAN
jgi:hypothetical protein